MRLFIFLLSFLGTLSSIHAASTIKGTITKWAGKTGKLYKYLDFISYEQQQIAEIQLDVSGYFEVSIEVEDYSRIRINIEKKDFWLYLQKKGIYTIGVKKKEIKLLEEENTDFNTRLLTYQDRIDAIAEKYNNGRKKKSFTGYKALQPVKEILSQETDKTLKQFMQFEITKWETQYLSFGGKKNEDTEVKEIDQLFLNTPVPYNNPFYYQALNLLMEFRINYIPWRRIKDNSIDFYEIPFKEIDLYQNTLPEDVVKALVVDLFYTTMNLNTNQEIKNKLQATSNSIEDSYFRESAERVISKTNQSGEGTTFPNFQLQDKTGSLKELSSFQSEYVLIDFWTTWCGICLKEMKSFDRYLKKYGDRLQIISISEDDTFEKMQQFVTKKNYHWDFLYGGEDHQLARQIGVNYFPTYFILDKDRKIISRPKGEFNLENVLDEIVK